MWCVKLSDSQRDALIALIKAQCELGPSVTAVLEALDLARWDDLPDAELPWDSVAELARAQGIGEADVVWDLAAGMSPKRARRGTALRAGVSRRCRSPRPALRPSLPSAISSRTRSGTSAPIDSPIAAATSRPDEVEQRQRAHRVAGAELHAGVDALGVDAVALEQAHGVEQVGEEQPVDDEAGGVGHLDRGLLEPLAEAVQLELRLGRRLVGEGQLDQLHLLDRVEHVQRGEAVRAAAGGGELGDRERGGGGGQRSSPPAAARRAGGGCRT